MSNPATIIITGSRRIMEVNFQKILDRLHEVDHIKPTRFILGDARGVDEYARKYCGTRGLPFQVHYAEWSRHGRAAGPIRNQAMLVNALKDTNLIRVIAIWDQKQQARGTADMIQQAMIRGIEVLMFNPDGRRLVVGPDGFPGILDDMRRGVDDGGDV